MTRLAGVPTILLALVAASAPANAATYPAGFQEEPIVEDLDRPTAAVWAPDGQMFVAEQDGVLKEVNPNGSTDVVIDIKALVNSGGDRGFLGIAADSAFGTGPGKNRYFYLLYTAETHALTDFDSKEPMVSRLMRIEIDTNNDLVPGSQTVILGTPPPFDGACPPPSNTNQCIPSDANTHSIGSIHSMPDGTLMVGSGDGADYNVVNANAVRSQNEQSYAGKILHIDRNGNGLPGHPFCPSDNDLTHVCTKIHQKGFRNPFRFKPNPEGGFNLGDVGQGSLEEIDIVGAAGKNYGWPCYEGTTPVEGYEVFAECIDLYDDNPSKVTMPDYEYDHVDDHAIIGGPTYTADEYPPEYDGRIFFGDYAAGFLKVLERNAQDELVELPFSSDWVGVDLVSAPNGDIAYASFGTGENGTGSIQRIVYSPNNAKPVAVAVADPQSSAGTSQTVEFDGSGSTDADGDDLSYEWEFDDGDAEVDSLADQPTFHYAQPGTYDVVLTVDDGRGKTDTTTVRVDVGNTPPVPSISAPAQYTNGDTVTLQGSATDAQDDAPGGPGVTDFSWRSVLVHGGHTHGNQNNVPGPTLQTPTDGTHGADSHYEATLTATDSGGLTGTKTVRIDPRTTTLRLQSLPAGGDITLTYYSNNPLNTPYQALEAINFQMTVVAEASFTVGGRSYVFQGWADGPTTRARNLTVPGAPTTLVARYRDVTPPSLAPKPAPDRTGPVFGFNSRTGLHTRRSRLRGVVADPAGVKRTKVAVGRKYRSGRCAWWSTRRRRLSAAKRRCDRPAWIAAKLVRRKNGAYDWVARLRRRLPRGDYRIAVWAEDARGNAARRLGNGFRLRKR